MLRAGTLLGTTADLGSVSGLGDLTWVGVICILLDGVRIL